MPRRTPPLAISPDGHRVYAIDAKHGTIAVVNVRRFRVAQVTDVDLSALGGGRVAAQVSSDGATLYLAGRRRSASPRRGDARRSWRVDGHAGAVTGLAVSDDGARLYLSYGDLLQHVDATTLVPAQPVPLANAGWVEAVSSV